MCLCHAEDDHGIFVWHPQRTTPVLREEKKMRKTPGHTTESSETEPYHVVETQRHICWPSHGYVLTPPPHLTDTHGTAVCSRAECIHSTSSHTVTFSKGHRGASSDCKALSDPLSNKWRDGESDSGFSHAWLAC